VTTFLQQLINGLTLGSVYALIALGYTMVYGIIQLINFAHGEVYMVGAYLGIIFLTALAPLGLPPGAALLIAFLGSCVYCGAYGFALERVAYRPLRGAPRLSPLISALGMSIFLQNFVMLTQGTRDKVFPQVIPLTGIMIREAHITYLQIIIMVCAAVLMVGLHLFIKNTKLGTAMRATSQDMKMAAMVGIDINRVISVTFIIGSMLAAAAGVMIGLYYGLVNFFIGYIAGIKAFTAAVLGGIGNIPGAMLGGILLGLLESFGAGYVSAEFKDVFAFGILILILIVKPTGLLGENVGEKS